MLEISPCELLKTQHPEFASISISDASHIISACISELPQWPWTDHLKYITKASSQHSLLFDYLTKTLDLWVSKYWWFQSKTISVSLSKTLMNSLRRGESWHWCMCDRQGKRLMRNKCQFGCETDQRESLPSTPFPSPPPYLTILIRNDSVWEQSRAFSGQTHDGYRHAFLQKNWAG